VRTGRAEDLRCFGYLALLVALTWVSSAGVAQAAPLQDFTGTDSANSVIYVVRRGWHIDIGFDTADLVPPLAGLTAEFTGVRFLFFGFGDRRYLQSKERNVPVLLGALLPGRGLILTTGLTSTPQLAFGARQVIALHVPADRARDAQSFIWHTLDWPHPDGAHSEAAGPYAGSFYFAAKPGYSALHTCNTWVAEALAASGLPIHSAGVVFASQLWRQVRRLEQAQSIQAAEVSRAEHRRRHKQPSLTSSAVPPP
jgi:hypothetical protein